MRTADQTLADWLGRCGGPAGGDNLFNHGGRRYALYVDRERQNGAIEGHVSRFGDTGLITLGSWKINPDGSVANAPDELRDVLVAAQPLVVPT